MPIFARGNEYLHAKEPPLPRAGWCTRKERSHVQDALQDVASCIFLRAGMNIYQPRNHRYHALGGAHEKKEATSRMPNPGRGFMLIFARGNEYLPAKESPLPRAGWCTRKERSHVQDALVPTQDVASCLFLRAEMNICQSFW